MKLYVAGIDFRHAKNKDLQSKTQSIIKSMAEISKNAEAALSHDALTLIVLPEYALTPKSIPNEEKKKCLAQLEQAVKKYKNLILIPGSFSAYEEFSKYPNPEQKKKEIVNNYTKNLDNPEFQVDPIFMMDYLNTKDKYMDQSIDNGICLQNSAYILTGEPGQHRIKHKKSFPWNEQTILTNPRDYFFDVGSDNPIKKISINHNELDMGIIICREHITITSQTDQVKGHLPPIEVIISASIETKENNLFGAINIHMDEKTGLSIRINDAHPKSRLISEIKSACYYPFPLPLNIEMNKKIDVPIVHFNNALETTATPQKSEMESNRLKKGFFNTQTKHTPQEKPEKKSKTETNGLKRGFFNTKTNHPTHQIPEQRPNTAFGGLKKGFLG